MNVIKGGNVTNLQTGSKTNPGVPNRETEIAYKGEQVVP